MINLNARRFSPISNSEGGRVQSDAVFIYTQDKENFTATYSGQGALDGHIIGKMTGKNTAELVYHSRTPNGDLEVGEAKVTFLVVEEKINMTMAWQWLNGSKTSGTSHYGEI